MRVSFAWIFLLSWSLTACGSQFEAKSDLSSAAREIASENDPENDPDNIPEVPDSITCEDARAKVFSAYLHTLEDQPGASSGSDSGIKSLSKSNILLGQIRSSRQSEKIMAAPKETRGQFENALSTIHHLMVRGTSQMSEKLSQQGLNREDETDPVLHLIRLEMRSELENEYTVINQQLDQALFAAKTAAQTMGLECDDSEDENQPPIQPPIPLPSEPNNPSQILEGLLRGAHWTMATAYQSCDSIELPPVTSAVSTVLGVVRDNKVDSVGYGRKYTDLSLLKQTHYYHRGQTYGPGCENQNFKPLVYDYGGAPKINSAKNELDLFTNQGGGSALGVDCSAFVSTAAAVAGLLYKPSTQNRPAYTRFVSRDFIDPKKSGWSCYDSVETSSSSSIQTGDIAAVAGHVVIVDEVGEDPFGLRLLASIGQCETIDSQNFDFRVIQSSPSKEHLGINRYEAKDYLKESSKVRKMFLAYAKAACRSHFDGSARRPVTASYGIIRHKGTSNCQAPRIALKNESCIATCSKF